MLEKSHDIPSWTGMFLRLSAAVLLIVLAAALSAGLMAQRRGALKTVKTDIPVAYKASLAVSDEIIVFGTGFNTGVEYIRPGDKTARQIPDGDKFSSKFFAAAGTKIILADPSEFTVAVFDTATGKLTRIPESELKLRAITGGMHDGGSIHSSGDYAVVITDTSGDDNSALKVIDVSGAEPRVIRFEGSGPDASSRMVFQQVAVDADSGLAAGAGGTDYDIKLFEIANPDKPPRSIDLEQYRGVGKAQMQFDDGKILFQTGEAYQRAMLLDTATGGITELTRAKYGMALEGGTYVYFGDRDAKDSSSITGRAAVGKVGGQPKFSAGSTPVGGSKNNGLVGFGASAAVTPDGQIFIAGMEDVGRTERFQTYRGAKFALQPDASVNPRFLQASDVVASSKLVAFKTGADNRTTLGYIVLK